MDTVRGIVSNLHTTTRGKSIATFILAGGAVQIRATLPAVIAEGDEITVMGPRKSGILIAYAYRNHTQCAQGSAGAHSLLMYSSGFMLLTLIAGIGLHAWNDANTALVIGLIFAGGAAYFSLALRIRKAERSVFEQPPGPEKI